MTTNTDTTTFRKEPGIYYCACVDNEKSYIGQSVNVYVRINHAHIPQLRGNRHGNNYMQHSWNKYGEESFKWIVLEYCSEEELNDRERYWIEQLSTEYPNGFNLSNGGDNLFKRSESSRKKMSDAWTEERKNDLAHKNIERWSSPEKREKMCQSMVNAWTEERRKIISNAIHNRWANMSEQDRKTRCEHIRMRHGDMSGDKNPRARSIKCVETNETFSTIKTAAAKFNINYSTLKGHLQGKLDSVHNLHFEYI